MQVFKDKSGQEWKIEVTASASKRVTNLLKFELLSILEGGEAMARVYTDPVFLVDLLYVVCRPQAEERGVTDEQFGELFDGPALEVASAALLDDLISFSPRRRETDLRRQIKAKTEAVIEAGYAVAEKRIADLDPSQIAASALASAGTSSGSVAESSTSTPAT